MQISFREREKKKTSVKDRYITTNIFKYKKQNKMYNRNSLITNKNITCLCSECVFFMKEYNRFFAFRLR